MGFRIQGLGVTAETIMPSQGDMLRAGRDICRGNSTFEVQIITNTIVGVPKYVLVTMYPKTLF